MTEIEKILSNNEKMQWMCDEYGDYYFDLFSHAMLDLELSIQDAIDFCYERLTSHNDN